MQEFKECTFKPAVHPVPPKEKEPVVIKGLGRHLELQDLAKQMRKDQEEWERKVFFTHVIKLSLASCSDVSQDQVQQFDSEDQSLVRQLIALHHLTCWPVQP